MEQTASRNTWKEIVIGVLVLLLLALLVWLFLRPWEPARQIVFGELGRHDVPSNSVAGGPVEAPPAVPANLISNVGQGTATISQTNEPAATGQSGGVGDAGSMSVGAGMSNNQPPSPSSSSRQPPLAPSNSVASSTPTSPPPPAKYSPARAGHSAWTPDMDAQAQEPANKDTTAKLLAEAKAADMARVNPIPARTADLLGNDSQPWRWFDPEAGSNVVFILDNSLSMMTNGKSFAARQEVARTLQSMNAGKSFYVLFFHSGGYEDMPALAPLPASPENVRAMTNWLFSVGHRTGADPTKAMQRALGLAPAPDTVWLLSGSQLPDKVIDNIRQANASVNAHVNTIELYTRDGEEAMRQIANENRGVNRFVPPPDGSPP